MAPKSEGGWMERPVATAEAGEWLVSTKKTSTFGSRGIIATTSPESVAAALYSPLFQRLVDTEGLEAQDWPPSIAAPAWGNRAVAPPSVWL